MIAKKEFYFVRHGQTDGNLFLLKTYGDISLNETGREQARAIEPLIASLPIKTICCSPLKRAKETKEICCARLMDSVHHSEIPDLTECDAEIWKKMTSLGRHAHLSTEEPVYSFMQRVKKGIDQALSQEGPVLIVAHGGVHWAISCLIGVEHEWVIGNCVPVHFSLSSADEWVARKLK